MDAGAGTAPIDRGTDERWMRDALDLARGCVAHDDVPIGCVVVRGGAVVSAAGNERELRNDPTAHAEVLALRAAAERAGSWRLDGHTLYVTLEPCAMCAGAIVLARVDRVVVGAMDPKAGFAGSLGNLLQDARLNHRARLTTGVLAEACGDVLRAFFRERRGVSGPSG
ncbi:MAG TPA: tRNA adenosine(34) deaminase TadA [Actinomycetota bacterium]|nr:tRNA adenosine(34) deaminase TadA [Actinomycetota bacterium]